MNRDTPPTLPEPKSVPSQAKVLRKLFLTLFLRGRTSRGLKKDGAPASLGTKMLLTLLFYALFGCLAFAFIRQPVFSLSIYLHSMTMIFLGMFVAASAGEVLFNKEETDILMHRPVTPQALLWAKITVMVQISLWLAGAFNLAGFVTGYLSRNGGVMFPLVHALSIAQSALFCTGSVVLVYQLCLKWFGREKLDNLMTLVQVVVTILFVMGGQMMPYLMRFIKPATETQFSSWWVYLLPPAWFAGFDDALGGSHARSSWALGGCGLLATATVLWFAFEKLSQTYEVGLQQMNETAPAPAKASSRWLARLVKMPPLCWWLRDSVSRASFLVTAAYLWRDRDVKLRIYPGLAPMLIMPIIMLLQGVMRGKSGTFSGFGIAFAGSYLGLVPLQAIGLLQFSQHWQASDLYRIAPLTGPGQICHGARRAVLLFLTLPVLASFAIISIFISKSAGSLEMLLPGLIGLPLFAIFPYLGGNGIPLSQPLEGAKSTRNGLLMMGVMMLSMMLSGLAIWAKSGGWFWWLIVVEIVLVSIAYWSLRYWVTRSKWPSMD